MHVLGVGLGVCTCTLSPPPAMVVRARIAWVRERVLAGHQVAIHLSFSAQAYKTKVRLDVRHVPDVTPLQHRQQIDSTLDLISRWCDSPHSHAVDRGHRHYDGHSVITLWLALAASSPRTADAGDDGGEFPREDPQCDDEDDSQHGGDHDNADGGDGARSPDPWDSAELDPWRRSSGHELHKRPRACAGGARRRPRGQKVDASSMPSGSSHFVSWGFVPPFPGFRCPARDLLRESQTAFFDLYGTELSDACSQTCMNAQMQLATPPESHAQLETPPESHWQLETPPESHTQLETPPEDIRDHRDDHDHHEYVLGQISVYGYEHLREPFGDGHAVAEAVSHCSRTQDTCAGLGRGQVVSSLHDGLHVAVASQVDPHNAQRLSQHEIFDIARSIADMCREHWHDNLSCPVPSVQAST